MQSALPETCVLWQVGDHPDLEQLTLPCCGLALRANRFSKHRPLRLRLPLRMQNLCYAQTALSCLKACDGLRCALELQAEQPGEGLEQLRAEGRAWLVRQALAGWLASGSLLHVAAAALLTGLCGAEAYGQGTTHDAGEFAMALLECLGGCDANFIPEERPPHWRLAWKGRPGCLVITPCETGAEVPAKAQAVACFSGGHWTHHVGGVHGSGIRVAFHWDASLPHPAAAPTPMG